MTNGKGTFTNEIDFSDYDKQKDLTVMENRYDKYKDSGIAWIGVIPEHWEIIPHKRIMRKKKIIKEIYAGENILSLTKKGVIIRDLEAGGKMPTTFNGYQILYPNNLLLCLFDIDVTPRCVGIIKNVGLSSPAYSQFVLNKLGHTPFFDYLLKYMDDEKCLLHLSKNLRNSLTEEDFGQIETILPPISEQQAIADYLDRRCSEIDDLIALQEEMITKLQSYKQSVITEAVTRGLDKNVPLKDSGIDWIGKVPEHWKVKRLKFSCNIFGRIGFRGYKSDDLVSEGEGAITLSPSNMKDMKMDYTNRTYLSWKKYYESPEIIISNNDILMVKTGSTYGKCSFVENIPMECTINPQIVVLKRHKDYSKFLAYSFQTQATRAFIETSVVGGTIPTIAQEKIMNYVFVFPPLAEQQAIADYLDQRCSEIDELIALKQQKIEKLKEYKKSLIFECVTGKRKVS